MKKIERLPHTAVVLKPSIQFLNWSLPFHDPYEAIIEPGIADLDNAPGWGFAGSGTAALFLRRFVNNPRYLHFDIYAHTPSDQPARPKGGVGQGARAVFAALPAILGL